MNPKILIADDHSMIRKGVKLLLEWQLGCTDVKTAASCSDIMKELNRENYTHMILDLILSDGSALEILPNIQALYPNLKICILSMQPASTYRDVLQRSYNITHYISKASQEEKTIEQLKLFIQNQEAAPGQLTNKSSYNPFSNMTPRELEILHYMLKGKGSLEIAQALNLKMNTISTVKNRIFEKTGTTNIIELKELASLCKVG